MLLTPLFFAALAGAVPQFGNNQRFTMLRFGCAQSVIDRIDPLVNPGLAPSPHMHQIAGGNAFNTTMPSTDISKLASCTTCGYSEDQMSISKQGTGRINVCRRYQTGSLYDLILSQSNGLIILSDLFNDKYTGKTTGGFVVYYVSGSKGDVTAFKPGFRMLVGDAANRVSKNRKSQTCFRCYTGPNFGGDNAAPCQDANCWDGVNLDSPDHKSHVAYPTNGPALFTGTSTGGACPASHPIVWDTTKFNNKADWPADGSQPFVLSTGDNTGYGQHGDYVFGWKDNSLQKAMDDAKGCMGANCGSLKTQQPADGNKCVVPNRVPEERDGWMKALPGMDGMPME
ncbi:hypothetical protein GGP41_010090 [Bipolaris sorokiniana]|uniref:DUF1996 domain-containing protein n=1 Tax=Cochliobolus sativus TaxID=45130 RepID=A0A8H5ZIX9_COCSA|nr:hypothetical protein GGP41_010090 [Bipolaris sorokiniana]